MAKTNGTAKDVFLEALSRSVDVSKAARAALVGRTTVYHWRAEDETFAQAWDDALTGSVDQVEDVAFAMATSGEHPTMTQFVLKSWRGDRYNDKQRLEVTGANGGPIEVVEVPTSAERATELAKILKSAGAA